MTLRVLVADDEAVARQRVVRLLEASEDVQVVAACIGGEDAVDKILELKPDVVFLDVQMPDLDGFGVLQAIEGRASPIVVFVTAFDQYAVRAFSVHALDYLLKPYDEARFREALRRARALVSSADRVDARARLKAAITDYLETSRAATGPRALERIAVKTNGVVRLVRAADVDWWETDGNYMRMHVGQTNHLIRATANALEAQLDPRQFVRIHRRYIVNLDRVLEIHPWFGGDAVVVLRTGAKLRLSRTYRERLNAHLLGSGTASVGG